MAPDWMPPAPSGERAVFVSERAGCPNDRWAEPMGLLRGAAAFATAGAARALPLHGGALAYSLLRLMEDGAPPAIVAATEVPPEWAPILERMAEPVLPFAGIAPAQPGLPLVMGILNATPDSFSDGGQHADPADAIARGHAMLEAGAAILDVGGESTRPGAAPVTPEDEIARILPVVRELAKSAPVSVDTRHAATMRAALEAGAEIVNDVTALRHDPGAMAVVAAAGAPVVLMHMPGTDPAAMQGLADYDDVVLAVARHLAERVAACEAAGIPRARIAIDPGIGFGKTMAHNLALLDRLAILHGLGCPVMVGASRKRFVGTLSGVDAAARRVAGSVGAALAAASRGAAILRVHDVAETVQALRVWHAAGGG